MEEKSFLTVNKSTLKGVLENVNRYVESKKPTDSRYSKLQDYLRYGMSLMTDLLADCIRKEEDAVLREQLALAVREHRDVDAYNIILSLCGSGAMGRRNKVWPGQLSLPLTYSSQLTTRDSDKQFTPVPDPHRVSPPTGEKTRRTFSEQLLTAMLREVRDVKKLRLLQLANDAGMAPANTEPPPSSSNTDVSTSSSLKLCRPQESGEVQDVWSAAVAIPVFNVIASTLIRALKVYGLVEDTDYVRRGRAIYFTRVGLNKLWAKSVYAQVDGLPFPVEKLPADPATFTPFTTKSGLRVRAWAPQNHFVRMYTQEMPDGYVLADDVLHPCLKCWYDYLALVTDTPLLRTIGRKGSIDTTLVMRPEDATTVARLIARRRRTMNNGGRVLFNLHR